jgi:transcription-repair coupling factor (superfamily II helicase)
LFTTVRCRKIALELGFERMTLKNKTLRCYFVNNPDSPYFNSEVFQSILLHIQTKTNKSHLKQVGKNFMLVTEEVSNMKSLYEFLQLVISTVKENAVTN